MLPLLLLLLLQHRYGVLTTPEATNIAHSIIVISAQLQRSNKCAQLLQLGSLIITQRSTLRTPSNRQKVVFRSSHSGCLKTGQSIIDQLTASPTQTIAAGVTLCDTTSTQTQNLLKHTGHIDLFAQINANVAITLT